MMSASSISSLSYWLLVLLAVSMGFQFDYVFSVYFIVPLLVVILSFLLIVFFYQLRVSSVIALLLFVFVLFLVSFNDEMKTFSSLRKVFGYYGYVIVSVFVASALLREIDGDKIIKVIKVLLLSATAAVVVETFLRVRFPTLGLSGEAFEYVNTVVSLKPGVYDFIFGKYFYAYKYSSVMFFDSNYVGLYSLVVFVLALFVASKSGYSKFLLFLISINFFLVLLSFSRSAIFTMCVVMALVIARELYVRNRKAFLVFTILFIPVFVCLAFWGFSYVLSDGSFMTKVEIFSSLGSVFSSDLSHVLFGFGVEEGSYVYSYKEGAYAHALIPLAIGQIGLIGLALYVSVTLYLSARAGFYGWMVFLIFFISGFSLVDLFQVLNFFVLLLFSAYLRAEEKERGAVEGQVVYK